ncbi:hypothetical protein GQ43DRAFT_286743 [Delitschia confertaspora ATCC 74209]|uniref:BZIP domain-containing protein n=1 Tax=Delitschia confertaspora ATCC 74209 TaxID=1513339 RepID=A0A9P4JUM5_9PLEO|nr:hypothetical protein GQ43DRAFT_286743 [Delitschia confertaspora ATCC 74209]
MEADQIHSFSPMNSFTTPLSPISITAQTSSTPTLPPAMFSYHGTPPPTTVDPASTTIKMEEFRSPSLSESPSPSTPSNSSSTGPKPAKKRKSWGQVLPEPKTNLPPRKRAKTEDEKEQRRIERVKRNRLAAHNSRERKRQEVEQLQAEKDKLERDLREAREAMARMAAELNIYRQRHPGEVPESQHNDLNVSLSIEDSEPILQSTICPRQTSFPSPLSMDDMDTPRDYSLSPETPEYNHPQAYESDQTRFPAAKLCDLLCQSDSSRVMFHSTMAFLVLFQLHLSLMTQMKRSSTSTNSRRTPRLAWEMARALLSIQSSFRMTTSQIRSAVSMLLAQTTSICRQIPAQHTMLATNLASQRSSSGKKVALSGVSGVRPAFGSCQRRRRSRYRRPRLPAREQNIERTLYGFSRNLLGQGKQGLSYQRSSVSS